MPFGSYLLMINLHWFWLTVDYKQNLTKQIITGDQFIDGGGYIVVVSLDGGICFERCYPEWHLGELKSQRKATTEALVRILSMPSHNCLVLWIPSCRLQDGWSGLNLPSALQNWGRDPWAFSCWPPPLRYSSCCCQLYSLHGPIYLGNLHLMHLYWSFFFSLESWDLIYSLVQ